jgi:uridine kinase
MSLFIGIAGGSGSGKSTIVHYVRKHYGKYNVAYLPMDAYYRDNSHISQEERQNINFDHPDAIDFDLMQQQLDELEMGAQINRPTYSFLTHTRQDKTIRVHPSELIIVEGLFTLSNETIREFMDMKIFVEVEMTDRLDRIIARDTKERGRDDRAIKKRFLETVQPMHEEFVQPSKEFAELVVDGSDTKIAADKIIDYVKRS